MSPYDDDIDQPEYDTDYRSTRPRRPTQFPTFCTVVFIVDLILCCIRLILVLFGLAGYQLLKQQGHPLAESAIYEIITGGLIALCGIPGNALMLAKQKWAVALGWMTQLATLAATGVGVWQAQIMVGELGANGNQAAQVGGYVGAGISIAIRLGIVICCVIALLKFTSWSSDQEY